jgi:hypothetical protein
MVAAALGLSPPSRARFAARSRHFQVLTSSARRASAVDPHDSGHTTRERDLTPVRVNCLLIQRQISGPGRRIYAESAAGAERSASASGRDAVCAANPYFKVTTLNAAAAIQTARSFPSRRRF